MKKIYLNTLKPEEIVKRLKNGEVAKLDMYGGTKLTTRMIDGVLVGIDEDEIQIGDNILIEKSKNDYYFEEDDEEIDNEEESEEKKEPISIISELFVKNPLYLKCPKCGRAIVFTINKDGYIYLPNGQMRFRCQHCEKEFKMEYDVKPLEDEK